MEETIDTKEQQQDQLDQKEAGQLSPEAEEKFNRFFQDKLMPYQRQVMIYGMILLIFLVVFLGYARGGLDVCNALGGRLEVSPGLTCHLTCLKNEPVRFTATGSPIIIPKVIIERNGTTKVIFLNAT